MDTETKLEENVIMIWKAEDGNWQGKMMKFGKLITVREVSPESVLMKLLTHE